MKYGIIATNPLEQLALWAGRVPVPLVDALYSLIKVRCLMAAVRLGLFEALRDAPRTGSEVAGALNLDSESTTLVLRTLVFADYLKQEGDRYALSPLARDNLIAGAPRDLTGFLEWNYWQWDMVAGLEELLRTGRGVDFHHTLTDPAGWASYQKGMLEVARFDAAFLAERVPVPKGARRLLDIAGSHGLLGAALCRRHPPLTSTVIDLPQALPTAETLARQAGHADVVSHRPGDITRDAFEPEHDVALLANALHHFDPATNRDLLNRVWAALNPGGTVAIWEIESADRSRPAGEGDGATLFFRLTSTAACYHGTEYAAWLGEAGFTDVRIIRRPLPPRGVLIVGRRPISA